MLFLVVDIFDNIGNIIENPVPLNLVIVFFLTKLPYVLFLTLPMAIMLATFVSLGLMGRNLETIAMMSGGISHGFIIRPVLIMAALLSIMSYLGNEYVVPQVE